MAEYSRFSAVNGPRASPRSAGPGAQIIILRSPSSILYFPFFILCLIFSCLIFSILIPGCGTAVDSGQNTALDSADLRAMTDQMSSSILGDAAVQQAILHDGPLKVVVEPVENQMQAEVLPAGPADAFTARLRSLLSHHAPNKFTWILNLRAFHQLREHELEGVQPGPFA